ncbi:MAG: NrsF family protein [Alphaproteobacteria bacterium]
MRTDALIRALAADETGRGPPIARRVAMALAIGVAVAVAAFLWVLGPRDDLLAVASTPRFLLKPAATLLLAATAFTVLTAMARPGHDRRRFLLLAAAPAVLAIAIAVELAVVSPSGWRERAIGSNALICLTAVPLLSLAPLATLIAVLRHGAPTAPAAAGAVAGLVAGGMAAALYAIHCTDDSPLFVATWYIPAIAIPALGGALAGRRLLRW